ncbi:MAG: hypothetical protein QM831_19415 [Kofleriaceae bacterium]
MMSSRGLAWSILFLAACGGGSKKPKKPEPKEEKVEAPPPETDASRESKRKSAIEAITPPGTNCLPKEIHDENGPQLEIGIVGNDAILCAVDRDPSRALGDIGCWKVDIKGMTANSVPLIYQDPAPQPGHDLPAMTFHGCARGFCSPGKTATGLVHLSWSFDGKKVAMLSGTDVHLFDAESKQHLSTFGIAGDKGVTGTPTAIHFVADSVIVEGGDDPGAWVFKADGTVTGQIMAMGGKEEKPLSLKKGALSVLDDKKVGLADHGMTTFTTYEVETGRRSKAIRKPTKAPCKPAEIEAYWNDGDKVTDKCRDALDKGNEKQWVGATALQGSKSLVFVTKGDKLGSLSIVDPKTLEVKKSVKMEVCGGGADGGGAAAAPAEKEDAPKSRGAQKKDKGGDPQDGGE